jgi:hypothetical protein
MSTPPADRAPHSGWCRIRIKGRLASRWAIRFDGMTLTDGEDGTTLIEGLSVDQAALHGLLQQVRDTGLPLMSVDLAGPDQAPAPPPGPAGHVAPPRRSQS